MSLFEHGKRPADAGEGAQGGPQEGAVDPAPSGDEAPEGGAARSADDPDGVAVHANTPVPSEDELRAALAWAFAGEEIEAAVLGRFAQHARLVLAGNQRLNLTAIVEPREVAAKHYLDSWRTTRLLPLGGRSLLDLGTGGGFPGLPVALAEPQARVVALDSRAKRVEFVKETIRALGLGNASAVAERAEDHLARHKYDIVLVRAVSSVRENVRLLRKVRHSHKDLVMLKGPSWSREARAAEREAERLGFRLDTVWEHKLPGEMGDRAFLVYRAPGAQGL
ncbi:MAG: 16S rRNA (guanine(527)-N(7))-methyltransferase RsmG [Planctomycetes bacterium]|nr:16S rRNA (guanine(527)-N(7))-methyltransferase RsmG [Planctomycetota bacterium]